MTGAEAAAGGLEGTVSILVRDKPSAPPMPLPVRLSGGETSLLSFAGEVREGPPPTNLMADEKKAAPASGLGGAGGVSQARAQNERLIVSWPMVPGSAKIEALP